MHVENAQMKRTTREGKMDYRDLYVDFEWRRIEGESAVVEESPLDALVRKEDMRQLSDSLLNLDKIELACVMMMHYDENKNSVSTIQSCAKTWFGKNHSYYKLHKFDKTGLRKLRTCLRHIHGWER